MDTTILKRLLRYTKPYSGYILLSLICAAGSVVCTLLVPVLIGRCIDFIIGAGDVAFGELPPILLLLGLAVAGTALTQWLTAYFNNLITSRTVRDLRIQLFNKLGTVPLHYIDSTPHGDVINRTVNDIDMVSDGLLQAFTQLFTGVSTIIGTLLFMASVNGYITAAVVLLTPLSLFAASFIAKGSYRHFTQQTVTQGELTGYINEMVGNQKIVKGFGYEQRAQMHFDEINERLHICGQKAQFYSALTNPCTRFVNGIVYAAAGIIGALSAVSGHITVGQISMFLSYANQYTKPFNEISGIVTQLQSAFASARRVFEVIDQPDESPDAADSSPLSSDACQGAVEIRHVYFSYSPERRLIEDFTLKVKPGGRIAIVGPTGCGKTTFINLLMRFYDVNSGQILIDGVDIMDMPRDLLRRKFGMVLQETWLTSGTIRDNIAYGRPEAEFEQIIEAAKKAHAHSFIKRLPDGYDTVISEDGGNLSQGQKQLLCIARVMLAGAPILILDEATSNIDTRTEIAVQRAFAAMMQGHTSFVVAHRLSTIRESDVILVMDSGRIVEQGTHDELVAKGGFYAGLISAMHS